MYFWKKLYEAKELSTTINLNEYFRLSVIFYFIIEICLLVKSSCMHYAYESISLYYNNYTQIYIRCRSQTWYLSCKRRILRKGTKSYCVTELKVFGDNWIVFWRWPSFNRVRATKHCRCFWTTHVPYLPL